MFDVLESALNCVFVPFLERGWAIKGAANKTACMAFLNGKGQRACVKAVQKHAKYVTCHEVQ
eukprot:1026304-Karenia_brevis.AAC.1